MLGMGLAWPHTSHFTPHNSYRSFTRPKKADADDGTPRLAILRIPLSRSVQEKPTPRAAQLSMSGYEYSVVLSQYSYSTDLREVEEQTRVRGHPLDFKFVKRGLWHHAGKLELRWTCGSTVICRPSKHDSSERSSAGDSRACMSTVKPSALYHPLQSSDALLQRCVRCLLG